MLTARGTFNRNFIFACSKFSLSYFSIIKLDQILVGHSIPNILKKQIFIWILFDVIFVMSLAIFSKFGKMDFIFFSNDVLRDTK